MANSSCLLCWQRYNARLSGAYAVGFYGRQVLFAPSKTTFAKTFFDDMKAVTTCLCFESREHLLDSMLEG